MVESDFVAKVSPYALPGFQKVLIDSSNKFERLYRNRFDDLEEIFTIVCEFFNLPPEEVSAKCRKRELVWVRQVYCYISLKYTGWSLKKIGIIINGRDHTTVIHSVQSVFDLIDTEKNVRDQIESIEQFYKNRIMIGKVLK